MLYELDGVAPQLKSDDVFIAPGASVMGNVVLHEGSSVWFQCVLRGDNDPITVGANSNVQDGSICHTDIGAPLTIGDGVTVGHKVTLHGCSIGDNTLIGMGSTILNHAVIGKNSIVGAGSLITERKSFPDGVLIVGSPARVLRELKEEEIKMIALSSAVYVANAKRFKTGLKEI